MARRVSASLLKSYSSYYSSKKTTSSSSSKPTSSSSSSSSSNTSVNTTYENRLAALEQKLNQIKSCNCDTSKITQIEQNIINLQNSISSNSGNTTIVNSDISELEQRLKDYGLFKYDSNNKYAKVINVFPWSLYGQHISSSNKIITLYGNIPNDFVQTFKNNITVSPFGVVAGSVVESYFTATVNNDTAIISIDPTIINVPGIKKDGVNNSSIIMGINPALTSLIETPNGIASTNDFNGEYITLPIELATNIETEIKDGISFEYNYTSNTSLSGNSLEVKAIFPENVINVTPSKGTTITGKNVTFVNYDENTASYFQGNEIHGGYEYLIDTSTYRYVIKFIPAPFKPLCE